MLDVSVDVVVYVKAPERLLTLSLVAVIAESLKVWV
jgi:hypothetical protein